MNVERPKLKGQTKISQVFEQKDRNNRGGGQGNNHGNHDSGTGGEPSPWLNHPHHTLTKPSPKAGFTEYLRWMRELNRKPNEKGKDPTDPNTQVQILQMAQEGVNYQERLKVLNQRTQNIAKARQGVYFKVMCPWRIRVGGHRGPESILLPSFDALGVPYLPSSTLTGVARTAAIREFMQDKGMSWKEAEKAIAPYFGSIETTDNKNKAGKVIFLDAYPEASKSAGLAMDMANSIWRWDGDRMGDYSPNPNPFFSLKDVTFVIGICRVSGCNDDTFTKVKEWLIKGLQSGIGSQINSGYGELLIAGASKGKEPFFEVDFRLEGQLIHGSQKFERWNWDERRQEWQMKGKSEDEVRPIAFKSMLRYWFRVLARGFLSSQETKNWEANIFGAINPKVLGWLTVRVANGKTILKKNDRDKGKQTGVLSLFHSSECPDFQRTNIINLCKHLTWLIFSLGGVGQGARRPCYSRKFRPFHRGATIFIDEDDFWQFPETIKEFQILFRNHLQSFFTALSHVTGQAIDLSNPQMIGIPSKDIWQEVLDSNCRILVFSGDAGSNKPDALYELHKIFHSLVDEKEKLELDAKNLLKSNLPNDKDVSRRKKTLARQKYSQAKSLCGGVNDDEIFINNEKTKRRVVPSPIWINDQGTYQVVTIFGVSNQADNSRYRYLQGLQTDRNNFLQIFPLY
ncbi:MAG: RAMP superfamily CRISPR-associated protein [Pseudanabaena sp.]